VGQEFIESKSRRCPWPESMSIDIDARAGAMRCRLLIDVGGDCGVLKCATSTNPGLALRPVVSKARKAAAKAGNFIK